MARAQEYRGVILARIGSIFRLMPFVAPACAQMAAAQATPQIVAFAGSCATARPLEDLADYYFQVRTKSADSRSIRVRSRAIWDPQDFRNVLGTVPGGTVLWAQGPLEDANIRTGVGYAVAVQDGAGHACRGYIAGTVVDRVSPIGPKP